MIACVRLPYFAATITQLTHPQLADVPFVLAEPAENPREVYAVSPKAFEDGVQPGMTIREAQTLCADLSILPATPRRYRRVLEDVLAILSTFTSQVEAEAGLELRADARRRKHKPPYFPAAQIEAPPSAICYLDLGKLAEDEAGETAYHIHQAIQEQSRLPAVIGLANGKFTARVAATSLSADEMLVVPAGQEAQFLADYPVTLLPVDGETLRQLHLLGLRTLGQVAALPVAAVANRFGKTGRILHRLASGQDTSPVVAYAPAITERLARQFDDPLHDRMVLEAVLVEMVKNLVARLQTSGQMAREIVLVLGLENGAVLEHGLVLRQPSASVYHITQTVKDLLAAAQLPCNIIEVELILTDVIPTVARQLSLFARQPVPQDRLRDVLKDLVARYGEGCFYWARLMGQDARLPERRFRMEPVEREETGR